MIDDKFILPGTSMRDFNTLIVEKSTESDRIAMKMERERRRERNYLSKNLLRQTGALEEGDSFSTADTAVAIQIGTSEISIEEIYVRSLILN